MRERGLHGQKQLEPEAIVVPSAPLRLETVPTCHDQEGCAWESATMPPDPRSGGEEPADLVAQVSARKREVLLRVHGHRLGREELEDCFSQATLELVTRTRARVPG
jgi:hypothetical protein